MRNGVTVLQNFLDEPGQSDVGIILAETTMSTAFGISAGADVDLWSTAGFLQHEEVDSPLLQAVVGEAFEVGDGWRFRRLKNFEKTRGESKNASCGEVV